MTTTVPDYIKFLKTNTNTNVDYTKQRETYNRNFMRFQNRKLAYEVPYPYNLKVPFNYNTPQEYYHYYPTIYKDYSFDNDGHTPHFLNDMNKRKVDISGSIYDINSVPIRTYKTPKVY